MKVSDVMTKAPASCGQKQIWGRQSSCFGIETADFFPLWNDERVVSVITDRDICIALGTRNRLPGELMVGDVATQRAICCGADEDVRSALGKMAEAKVRRLPVVNPDGGLEGLLSMDDVIGRTNLKPTAKGSEPMAEDVVSALKKLSAPQLPQTSNKAAVA